MYVRKMLLTVSLAAVALAAGSARAEGPRQNVNFDDLKMDLKEGDEYKPSLITDKAKKLDGKPIRIKGAMSPSFKQDGITEFVLMRNTQCRFGSSDPIHHFIVVKLAEGESAAFSVRPITVTGKFKLQDFKIGKKVYAAYRLEGGAVE